MKNLSGGENEAEKLKVEVLEKGSGGGLTPKQFKGDNKAENLIVAEFRRKFKQYNGAIIIDEGNECAFEKWIESKLASEYARGVREVIEELEKKCEIMKYKMYCDGIEQELIEPSMIGYTEGLTDLQTFLKTIANNL